MYIKYNHEISSITKLKIEEYVELGHGNIWILKSGNNELKRYATMKEAEKELENIAKAIEEGKHI